jgi:2-oxoglutarate ferredoxin oxidoreductase subunit alpha
LKPAEAQRTKNIFALGLVSWLYGRPVESSLSWLETKFAKKPAIKAANIAAFKAGYNFGETTEIAAAQVEIEPAPLAAGEYRNIDGTQALALGLIAASVKSGLQPFFATYPITPASELLHHLARHDRFGVRTVQAEDEIAAVNMAVGAAFAGHLGITATSGPGMDLKAETIGLAAMLELPMVIIDVQRAGPSTGMPTKTEQTDLLMAIHGRHGESPLPVIASATPTDCFDAAVEAVRVAVRYRTPVILLSDTFLANSSEPWQIPDTAALPEIDPNFAEGPNAGDEFLPYLRDEHGARPWAIPGTPGLQHRIGGLEKENGSGNISYAPGNHALMTELRAEKLRKLSEEMPQLEVDADDGAELLVLGWGSTYGVVQAAARRVRERDIPIATAHLRHVEPLPANTGEVVRSFSKVLIPEVNTGQLLGIIRGNYLVDAIGYNKMEGLPIFAEELEGAILEALS